jgi:hypothetical protein
MSSEKSFRFRSRWFGFTVWHGSRKIKFSKGFYETAEPVVADFLRKQKEVTEISDTPVAGAFVAPAAAEPEPVPVALEPEQKPAETTDKPAKPSKSAK